MSAPDFRVPADIAGRRSTKKLLRVAGPQGFASWIFAQASIRREASNGDTSSWTAEDWALAGEWPGEPAVFLAALERAELVARAADVPWLDAPRGDGWVPVDWPVEQPHALDAEVRSRAASVAARARWNRHVPSELVEAIAADPEACGSHPIRNAPFLSSPSPSDPSLTRKPSLPSLPGATPSGPAPGPEAQAALVLTAQGRTPFDAARWPEPVRDVAVRLVEVLGKLDEVDRSTLDAGGRKRFESTRSGLLQFDDPVFWLGVDESYGAEDSGVFYLDAWRRFWTWHVARPLSRRRKDLKATFRNWLATAERMGERDAQREALRNGRPRR